MSFLDQVQLILWKDIRRLWWALAIVGVMLVSELFLDLHNPWAFEDGGAVFAYRMLSSTLLRGLLFLATVVIVGMLIHQEPLVGASPYWKTRPIRPGALLTAKALFVLAFLVLAPTVVEVIVLARFGLDPVRWIPQLVTAASALAFFAIGPVALAAITRNIPLYLLGLIGAIIGWFLSFWLFMWAVGRPMLTGWLPTLIVTGAAGWVVWRQYHRRDYRWSLTILASSLLLSPVGYLAPPLRLPAGERVQIAAISPALRQGRSPLEMRLDLADVERGVFYRPLSLSGALQFAGGEEVRGQASNLELASNGDPRAVVRAEFPGFKWFGHVLFATDARQPVLVPLEFEAGRRTDDWTVFRGTLIAEQFRYQKAGAVKPETGARVAGGSMRLEVMDIRRTGYSVVADLRSSAVGEAYFFQGTREEILLVHPRRKIVVRPNQPTESDSLKARTSVLMRTSGVVFLNRRELEFPLPDEAAQDLLDEFELQLWTPERIGRVTGEIDARR